MTTSGSSGATARSSRSRGGRPRSRWSTAAARCSDGLQLARELLDPDPAEARTVLDGAAENARAAIHELRELAGGLHPPVLAHRGLVAAVEALGRRTPLPVVVTASLPGRLPEPVETNAYFLVAEALANAVKHARASGVRVALERDGALLRIEVRDDGVGGARQSGSGTGPAGMADRVGALGGRLVLDTARGRGTAVRAEIPVGDG